jgi:hypothetical protein
VTSHRSKVDDDPSLLVGDEEALAVLGRILSVDSISNVSVDHEGADGLDKGSPEGKGKKREKTQRQRKVNSSSSSPPS